MKLRLFLILFVILISSCTEKVDVPETAVLPDAVELEDSSPTVEIREATGEVLYVPAYSSIKYMTDGKTLDLAVTLSIRNTDDENLIIIKSVKYYDNDGKLLNTYVQSPRKLNPMASWDVFVSQPDKRGGIGANFIVEWVAETPVTEPVVEAVMIGVSGAHGLSWSSPGRVISVK